MICPSRGLSGQNVNLLTIELMSDALHQEIETYRAAKQSLAGKAGKFVLIHESQVIGDYETYRAALSDGYSRFGIKPFLVHKIEPDEEVQQFSRDV
jgi:hypothetical protein